MIALSLSYTAPLICHPDTRSQAVDGITVRVRWMPDGALALTYIVTADCPRLWIPQQQAAARVDGLWRHTCFETFVAVPDSLAYQEWNFSPSGEWATYHFRTYRERVSAEEDVAPHIYVHQTEQGLELDARIRLPQQLTTQELRLALSAVIEDNTGLLSYWALRHPAGKPDFHHLEARTLQIAPLPGVATRGERQ